jgi:pimeloyl-ACP methyl ester carboxylesterase
MRDGSYGESMTTQVQPQDKSVVANGLKLHYLDWGTLGKPVMVLLHGLRGHAHSWDSFSEPMCRDYHVLALDQRGRGDSDWAPDGNYGPAQPYVEDLAGFCEALKLESLILAGHSLGGRNGIAFASSYPEKVKRLITVDSGHRLDPESNGRNRVQQELIGVPEEFDTFEDVYRHLRPENPLPPEDVLRRRLKYQTKELPNGKIGWRYDRAIRDLNRQGTSRLNAPLTEEWKKITCPILLVRGADSDFVSPSIAREMLDMNPNATMVELSGGHMVMEDNPDDFLAQVQRWLT